MYKSPIDMMSKAVYEIQTQQEEHILRGVLNVGINVDKEELIKALQYDRGQYDKGYADGVREFAESLKMQVAIDLCEAINCSDYLQDDFPKIVDSLVKKMEGDSVGKVSNYDNPSVIS